MTEQWVVLLNTGAEPVIYGPTEDQDTAEDFARFLTEEVDPATAYPLRSPTRELLTFWTFWSDWARSSNRRKT